MEDKRINYWLQTAENDWQVARHLFEKKDYAYALFFGHLVIEKILKAIIILHKGGNPPFSHRLTYLAEKADLELNDEQGELLEIITDFHLEARYPDEKFVFYKKCTQQFTNSYLEKIEGIKAWLLEQIRS